MKKKNDWILDSNALIITLIQKASDHGRVRITRRALTPVRKTAHGPGPVGSAECFLIQSDNLNDTI